MVANRVSLIGTVHSVDVVEIREGFAYRIVRVLTAESTPAVVDVRFYGNKHNLFDIVGKPVKVRGAIRTWQNQYGKFITWIKGESIALDTPTNIEKAISESVDRIEVDNDDLPF